MARTILVMRHSFRFCFTSRWSFIRVALGNWDFPLLDWPELSEGILEEGCGGLPRKLFGTVLWLLECCRIRDSDL